MEDYKIGEIVKGKITGIQRYGAFVKLNHHMQGLVHISEITNGYVKDIHDFLMVGDEVHVKVLAVDEKTGKISLSLRSAQEKMNGKRHSVIKVPKPTNNGFVTLKGKLAQWIEEAK